MLNISSKELEELLRQEEYKSENLFFDGAVMLEEKGRWRSYHDSQRVNGIAGHCMLMENLIEELGTLPTQSLYIKRGLKIAKRYWAEKKKTKWDAGHKYGFIYRLSTTYISKVIELHTTLKLKELFPKAIMVTHEYIDHGLGVDIVFYDYVYSKKYYIHILKDSPKSRERLAEKENRNSLRIGTSWYTYNRNFQGHCHLFYGEDNGNCLDCNGIALFTDEYLKEMIEKERQSEREGYREKYGQIESLYKWLKSGGHVEEGFKFNRY